MIEETARILVEARRSGVPAEALPESAWPADIAQAHAVQDATAAALRESIAGWKVAVSRNGEVRRGVILGSLLLNSPAKLPASMVPLLGVEVEIAFRFDRDMPPRSTEYTEAEVTDAVTALAGIEVVASRFRNFADTPPLHRDADCMSNGAFIVGTLRPDWRRIDLAGLEATLRVNGKIVVQRTGGHAAGDPLLPAVSLVNALRRAGGVHAGQIITTGSYTGVHFAAPGDLIEASFADFGAASVHFVETP